MYILNGNAYMGGYTKNQVELIGTFRKLWEQHIMWTRSFIISTAEGLDDLMLVTQRLLRNPSDFANVLKQYYNANAVEMFKNLFSDHLIIAASLVNAAKAGDENAVNEARTKWYKNADDIAAFLSSINPNWDEKQWKAMLYDHLKDTENEAVYRLTKQYEKDIAIYDHIEDGALKMADYMAEGIIKQFRV